MNYQHRLDYVHVDLGNEEVDVGAGCMAKKSLTTPTDCVQIGLELTKKLGFSLS